MSEESEPYTITRLRGELAITWYEPKENGEVTRKRYSLGTTNRVEAKELAKVFWQRRAGKGYETVGDIVPAWLAAHDHLSAHARNEDAWSAAQSYWADVRPHLINREVCEGYIEKRNRAPRTVRYEMDIVGRALRWAEGQEHIKKAPKLFLPAIPDRVVRHLTKEQFQQYIAATAAPHVRLFCMVAVATGGRKSAILQLQWDQVDLDGRIIMLNRPGRAQTAKRRATVPINDQLHAALLEAYEGRTTDYVIEFGGGPIADIKKGLQHTSRRCGIKATAHMFRHSAAVWMAEAGEPMEVIAQYLGHEDVKTTIKIYARFSPTFLRRAAKALEW